MATNRHLHHHHQQPTTQPRKVCFSFAAYEKTVIAALNSANVHVAAGLTDDEISAIESAGHFAFPQDLRSILSLGLPVGPGFPNWRSSSRHQLRLLISLPILSLSKEVSRNNFWIPSWGPRPNSKEKAHSLAQQHLSTAPPLVPVFRHCYIPADPNLAGNPVFYVHGGDVRLLSVDVGGFFKETEFWMKDSVWRRRVEKNVAPPWAETARRIEFWTEAAASEYTCRRWWSGDLSGCIEEVMWTLRNGGWGEEEVREMMLMDGCDEGVQATSVRDKDGVVKHVRKMSRELLNGGWSIDDVVYTLSDGGEIEGGILDGEAWVEFQRPLSNSETP